MEELQTWFYMTGAEYIFWYITNSTIWVDTGSNIRKFDMHNTITILNVLYL